MVFFKNISKFLLLLILITFSLHAWGKPLPTDKQPYVGKWTGLGMELIITQEGDVQYKRLQDGVSKEINGQLDHFEGDDFVVKTMFIFSSTFHVTQPPHPNKGLWSMTVDGIEISRPDTNNASLLVPDLETLNKITKESMLSFAQSVIQADFQIFFNHISKRWQVQTSINELEKAFHSFIEQKIDLRELIQNSDPVFSDTPHFNTEHTLLLKGYFPHKDFMTKFELSYIYEFPEWKLVGINVSVE